MATLWQTLKIFMCSTFQDLELARDQLAGTFRNIEKDMLERQIVIRPYDLRWRERHPDDSVVQWCIDMVRQCQYFVGMLGSRYGWRPPQREDHLENETRISITEMEILTALKFVAPERRFFCFAPENPKGETEEDLNSLRKLKKMLIDCGEKVFYYETVDELTAIVNMQFREIFDSEFPPGKKVLPLSKTYQDSIIEIIEEKVLGFVERKFYLDRLQQFVESKNRRNYLCCYGMAGTGKSTLVAKFAQQYKGDKIIHFINMGNVREIYRIMASIGEQLQHLGKFEKRETEPKKLYTQIQQTLQDSESLVLILDGLDDIAEEGKDLQWLPQNLPPQIRIILTTRPVETKEIIQNFPHVEMLEITPMKPEEVSKIIEEHSLRYGVFLKTSEKELLLAQSEGNPLYLKVALDELMTTGTAVEQLAKTVHLLFEQIIERLSQDHGKSLVNDYLGFIATGRTGAVEKDLKDLLEVEDSLLFSIQRALRHFLITRGGFLVFFHQEFVRTIKMMFGKAQMRQYSARWCEYFSNKGYQYIRTLEEFPYQLQLSKRFEELLYTLTDIEFLEAKVEIGKVIELCEDFDMALNNNVTPLPQEASILKEQVVVNRNSISLLSQILEANTSFLLHYPKSLWQCLWNLGYWHDYQESTSNTISSLLSYWQKNDPKDQIWLRSLHTPPERLDSPLKRLLHGHQSSVNSICFSPSGHKIASGSSDYTVKIWDVRKGFPINTLVGHQNSVNSVSFHPTENKIVSGSRDKTICVWNIDDGALLKKLHGHRNLVSNVAFSPNGKKIASCSWDKTIRIWDVATGETTAVLQGHESRVYNIAYNSDGTLLASCSYNGKILLWNLQTQQQIHCLDDHWGAVYDVEFSADDKMLVSCSYDKTICLWDIEKGYLLHTFTGHRWAVHSVSFNKKGTRIVSASEDKTIRLWDVEKKCPLVVYEYETPLYDACFSPDEVHILSCGNGKIIHLWEIKKQTQYKNLSGHSRKVQFCRFSTSNEEIVSASSDKTVAIWNSNKGHLFKKLKHPDRVDKFYLSKTLLASICWNHIYIWDLETGTLQYSLKNHKGPIHSICFSPDDKKIATGSWDKSICVWDSKNGNLLLTLREHKGIVEDLCFSPDGSILASASEDTTVNLWDMEGNLLHCLDQHERWVSSVCFHASGTILATGAWDERVCIWNAKTGELINVFQEHNDIIDQVQFHNNPEWLVSKSHDQIAKVWNFSQNSCIKTYEFCADINAVAKDFKYYTGIKNRTTVVMNVDKQIVAAIPSEIKGISLSSNDILTGYRDKYVYIMKMQSSR